MATPAIHINAKQLTKLCWDGDCNSTRVLLAVSARGDTCLLQTRLALLEQSVHTNIAPFTSAN